MGNYKAVTQSVIIILIIIIMNDNNLEKDCKLDIAILKRDNMNWQNKKENSKSKEANHFTFVEGRLKYLKCNSL